MTHPAAVNERYMRRALELAAHGRGFVSPNPMVGAVIVGPGDRIIGEGYHRRYGGPHAEVNAVNSVSAADRPLLCRSTIYVTLEPCSHFGKTPPCALLLKEIGIGRVVIGSPDPNPLVAGRGVAMLRQAGIEVVEGVLRQECMALNEVFMSAQIRRRPFVTLKWAQSADGYMDCQRAPGESAARFSTPVTSAIVHWRRSCADAIAVGAGTVLSDNPRLDVRLIHGRSPRPVVFDRHSLLSGSGHVLSDDSRGTVHLRGDENLEEQLKRLFAEHSISSLLVEGGARLLESFISQGLWDRAFVEEAPFRLGCKGRVRAPLINALPCSTLVVDGRTIYSFKSPGQA